MVIITIIRLYIRNHHHRSDSLCFLFMNYSNVVENFSSSLCSDYSLSLLQFFFQLVCASVMIFACQTKVNVISSIQNLQTQKSSEMLKWPSAKKFTFWKKQQQENRLLLRLENCFANFKTFSRVQDLIVIYKPWLIMWCYFVSFLFENLTSGVTKGKILVVYHLHGKTRILFTIWKVSSMQSTKNGCKGLKLVSKMARRNWSTNFHFETFHLEKQDYLLRCSSVPGNFPLKQKVVFHWLPSEYSWIFVNGKQQLPLFTFKLHYL